MTIAFDKEAIEEMKEKLYFADFECDKTVKIRDMVVKRISPQTARMYIASFHYSHTFPDSTLYAFAGYINNILVGVICFGMGCNKSEYTSLIPWIKNGEYAELTRLWCKHSFPRNTESKLISEAMKQLPPSIKLIVSYADESKGHIGTIYQATNFYYCGKTQEGTMLVDEKGLVKHSRLLGIYRLRHKEFQDMDNDELLKVLGYKKIGGVLNTVMYI